MKLGFRRAIVIGLGGTGVRTLVHIKREFIKHFQGLPPVVKLLGFDTDEASHETLQLNGENITLSTPEFTKLTAMKLRSLIEKTPEIQAWVPPEGRMSMRDIVGGTGARRPSGRLALFNRATQVYDTIGQAYRSVNALRIDTFELGSTECEVVDPERTTVFIVGSLAGGTGSGMLLDIAHMCRDILEDQSDPVFGFLLLAGVYAHRPATYFVEANTYAALKELDFFMETLAPVGVKYPGRKEPILWGGEDHRPFSYAYLIDNENERKLMVNEVDPMLDFISRAIFLHMTVESGARGGRMKSYLVNLSAILDALPPWQGKPPRYMGIGLSTLLLPVEEVTTLASTKAVTMLLERVLLGSGEVEEAAASRAVSFFEDKRLIKANSLLEALEASQSAVELTPLEEKTARKKDPVYVRDWRAQQEATIENRCAEFADKGASIYKQLSEGIRTAIASEVTRYMRGAEAVLSGTNFLQHLLRLLRLERDQLSEQGAEFKRELDRLEYPAQDDLAEAFRGPTRRIKLNRVLVRMYDTLGRQAELSRQQTNVRVAMDLLALAIEECEEYLHKIRELEDIIRKALEVSWARYRRLRQTKPLEDAFTIRLSEGYLEQDVEEIDRLMGPAFILEALEAEKKPFSRSEPVIFLDLTSKSPEDLYDWLFSLVRPRFAKIEDMTIENTLSYHGAPQEKSRAKEEAVVSVSQKFIDKACPMWMITTPAGRSVEEVFVFGVPYTSRGIEGSVLKGLIDDGKVELRGEGASRPGFHFALTWEKYCIRALKVKAAVPLSALNHVMQEYRDKYVELEKGQDFRYTAHVHKDWVGGQGLPELGDASAGGASDINATGTHPGT